MQNVYPSAGMPGAAQAPKSSELRGRLVLICLPLVTLLLMGVGIYIVQTASASGLALGYPTPNVHIAALTVNSVSVGQNIAFNAYSQGRDLTYTWDFGDQSPAASGESVNHTYSATNESNSFNYTVTVNVVDILGRSSSDSITFKVLPAMPVAQFTYSEPYTGYEYLVDFDASSSTYNTQSVTYNWDFGDSGSSSNSDSTSSPTDYHYYSGPGNYTVSLTVTDDAGQSNTATLSISVS